MVANSTTPQRGIVKVNIPDIGTPQGSIPEVQAKAGRGYQAPIASWSFGRITAEDHNKYKCYVSPYITSQLVMETRRQNAEGQFRVWNPLPDGATLPNSVPTLNLLGYRPNVERLNPEGLQSISDFEFPDNDGMSGRLCWYPELVARVSGHPQKMGDRYKILTGRPQHGSNSAAIGWTIVPVAGYNAIDYNRMRIAAIALQQ